MAALRQLLRHTTHCNFPIRWCAGSQGVSFNFPVHSKVFFSTSSGSPGADPSDNVAEINSIADAGRFASSPNVTPNVANGTDPIGGTVPSTPSPSVAEINSIADADRFASLHDESDLAEQDSSYTESKPRVANLPEDRTPEQLMSVAPEVGSELETQEKEEVTFPTLIKVASEAKRNVVILADAIREVKANARARFDETLEAHVRLGIDPRRSDQMVRGAATLPHGSGKTVRVAVFAEGTAAEEAQNAGADVVGADELVTTVQESGGKLNFDKCIATPSFMPKLAKVARILGPRGLMPNPKVGTVTNNVGDAVRAAKQGRVDFRADKTGIVHAGLGKVSFKDEALMENVAAFAFALLTAKPTGLKKTSRYAGYFNSFVISSTMGAGVRVTLQSVAQAADKYAKTVETR